MRNGIIWIHRERALKGANRQLRLSFFLQHFDEKYVRPCESGIHPYRALQKPLGIIVFLDARIAIREFVVRRGVSWIDLELFAELRDSILDLRVVKIELAKKLVRHRKLRIESDGFMRVFFGYRPKVLPQQHSRGEQVAGCRLRRHIEHFRKSFACVGIVLRLDVANPQDVRSIDIRAGVPRLYLFKLWNRLSGPPSQVIRESKQLYRLRVTLVLLPRFLKI